MLKRALGLGLLAAALAPASASAVVLVSAPPRVINCGNDIEMGVWYQAHSGGTRRIRLTVKSASGATLASRVVRATDEWESYWYSPRCGRRYRAVFTYRGDSVSSVVRVRRAPGSSSRINECGDLPSDVAYNLTTRRVACAEARRVVRRWNATNEGDGTTYVRGLSCTFRSLGHEAGDIRCTGSGGRVVRWQTGV